ncbi:AfsA-related hotdog domain-containing protein [Dactylosporangium sp. NPDC050688]|uniref:AfsA-related hotdog domain-containing protein n=1 Tax=Dactylosporangium sp. NPDC050688 TaxID=3157217 RepID=UPI0033F91EA7
MHTTNRMPVLRRLVHRASSATGTFADTAGAQEHGFALSAELPSAHPLYNDGPGKRHDPLFLAEALREAVVFIGHGYFRVPADRPAVFGRFEAGITSLPPWRTAAGPSHATVDLRVRAADPGSGTVPSALLCRATIAIGAVPCGSARLEVAFPLPDGEPAPGAPGRGRFRLLSPHAVGRSDARNVLVGQSARGEDDELRLDLAGTAAGSAAPWRDTPDGDLLEAGRQAAILTAGRLRGFASGHCTVTLWSGRFTAAVAGEATVRCTARPGTATRNRDGQPVVPVELCFTQTGTPLGTASVTVLEDG